MRIGGLILPRGVASRLLRGGDMRGATLGNFHKRGRSGEYFPAYRNYQGLAQDVSAFAERHSAPRCARGARRRLMFRDGADPSANSRYPIKQTGLLTAKSLDVPRRMLLVQNSAYYLAHIAVANSPEVHSIRLASRRSDNRNWHGEPSMATAYAQHGPAKSGIGHAASAADVIQARESTCVEGRNSWPADSSSPLRFSLGAAAVESFFHEI